jgi:anti-sigma factor RsiW
MMPDLASGLMGMTPEIGGHLAGCGACAGKMEEFQKTMALLDEWRAPEPSPYFDVRLQARLREEMAKPQASWLAWFRRPVLAAALTVLMAVGVGLFLSKNSGVYKPPDDVIAVNDAPAEAGTAVSDLQALEKNHDLYSDFDLLDDLEVQHDVQANP